MSQVAVDADQSAALARTSRMPDPSVMVIFGASGDLTSRKLIPALYYLYREGMLPEGFSVVGAARSSFSDDGFRSELRDAVKKYLKVPPEDEPLLDRFLQSVSYISGNFGDR